MGRELVGCKMINYRLMCVSDTAQIAAIEASTFSCPWSEASILGEITNPLSCWLVAEDSGTVVGYVGSQTVLDQSDMMNLAVLPEYRRNGAATALVNLLIEHLKQRGSCSLTLEVRSSNQSAISLYRKLGFEQIGLRPGYYKNPKEDACILRKEWCK